MADYRAKAKMAQLISEATENVVAIYGALKVRRYTRRNRLPHQSAYRYLWTHNGNRYSAKDAERYIERDLQREAA